MTAPDDTIASAEPARFEWRGAPVILILLVVLVPSVMLAISGSLLGPLDGDIPYPATAGEEAAYYGGRNLAWGAAAIAVLGAFLIAVIARTRHLSAAAGWGVAAFIVTATLGVAAFFLAFGAA